MTGQQNVVPSTDPAAAGISAAIPDVPATLSPSRVARRVYVVGIYLLAVAVVTQFLLAGLGIFFDPQFLYLWHATVGAGVIATTGFGTGVGAAAARTNCKFCIKSGSSGFPTVKSDPLNLIGCAPRPAAAFMKR